jgi:hypothetical protein
MSLRTHACLRDYLITQSIARYRRSFFLFFNDMLRFAPRPVFIRRPAVTSRRDVTKSQGTGWPKGYQKDEKGTIAAADWWKFSGRSFASPNAVITTKFRPGVLFVASSAHVAEVLSRAVHTASSFRHFYTPFYRNSSTPFSICNHFFEKNHLHLFLYSSFRMSWLHLLSSIRNFSNFSYLSFPFECAIP